MCLDRSVPGDHQDELRNRRSVITSSSKRVKKKKTRRSIKVTCAFVLVFFPSLLVDQVHAFNPFDLLFGNFGKPQRNTFRNGVADNAAAASAPAVDRRTSEQPRTPGFAGTLFKIFADNVIKPQLAKM